MHNLLELSLLVGEAAATLCGCLLSRRQPRPQLVALPLCLRRTVPDATTLVIDLLRMSSLRMSSLHDNKA